MKTNTKSTKPFKKLDCSLIKTKILRLPDKALKIWMCHLAHEGKGCQSYPNVETLMKVCGISKEDTVYKWRSWLATNHWLKKIGEIAPKRKGEYAVPIFSCTYDGTIPHQTGYGRQGHHTPPNGVRSHPIKRGTQPPRQTGVEVDLQQVAPTEVGKTTFLKPVVETGSFGDSCGTSSQAIDLPKPLAVEELRVLVYSGILHGLNGALPPGNKGFYDEDFTRLSPEGLWLAEFDPLDLDVDMPEPTHQYATDQGKIVREARESHHKGGDTCECCRIRLADTGRPFCKWCDRTCGCDGNRCNMRDIFVAQFLKSTERGNDVQ